MTRTFRIDYATTTTNSVKLYLFIFKFYLFYLFFCFEKNEIMSRVNYKSYIRALVFFFFLFFVRRQIQDFIESLFTHPRGEQLCLVGLGVALS